MAEAKGNENFCSGDVSKSNVKSTAAQAGSFINLRENTLFKSSSPNKGCNASVHQKNVSNSISRSQSENFKQNKTRIGKQSVRNVCQLDNSLDSKWKNSSDNLSVCTSKSRDLESRIKGIVNENFKTMNNSVQGVESNKSEEIKDNGSNNETDENLTKDYIDTRWEAPCTSYVSSQVLVPCPSCGRRFSQDAGYRHFPICSRMKEKGSTAKFPNVNNTSSCPSSSSPSFVTVVAENPLFLNIHDDGSGRKYKPIVYTFTRNGKKNSTKALEEKKKSSEQCKPILDSPLSSRQIPKFHSPFKFNKESGNSIVNKLDVEPRVKRRKTSFVRSDGVRKSASIWKKSVKEFKTTDNMKSIITVNKKGSNSSATEASSSSSYVDDNTLHQDSHICPTCGKVANLTERNRIGTRLNLISRKNLSLKHKINNKPISRSTKEISNLKDLDIIPRSMRLKDNVNKYRKKENCFDSVDEKNYVCFCCGQIIRSSLMESHIYLCQRIKNIEMTMSKDGEKLDKVSGNNLGTSCGKKNGSAGCLSNEDWKEAKEYGLFKRGNDSLSASSLPTVASLKCPCCSQLVDLRLKY